jgi:transcription-repair coupling factor (superfamily II helicase)
MRDLEIRGAGELLGTRQHGHIAAVGFHLYTRLLAQAVQRLQSPGETPTHPLPFHELAAPHSLRAPVHVDLPLSASIPSGYITDRQARLQLYRRIANLRDLSQVDALTQEFHDRFGPPPQELHNLLFQIKVKILAEKAGLLSIHPENGQLVLRFPPLPDDQPPVLPFLGHDVHRSKSALRLTPSAHTVSWQERLLEVLEFLVKFFPKFL